jgi:hypothetical protein
MGDRTVMEKASVPIAQRFGTAFNARDVDRVLACFAPDATYQDLFYGAFVGHPEIRSLFERMYLEGDRHEWTMTRIVGDPTCCVAEWIFTFAVSTAAPTNAGRTLTFSGVSIFETRDQVCHTYREHFDRGAALLSLGIPPGTVARIVERRPTVDVLDPDPAMMLR